FLSSTSTLFDKHLTKSRELVKEMLRERGLPIINTTASAFIKGDLKALKVNFKPVECNNKIAPEVDDLLPEQYILHDIHFADLEKQNFDVRKIDVSDDVRTFILKLHWVVKNSGTDETFTDTLMDDLLRIVGFNTFPLEIRNHQECRLFIGGHPYLTADPEFSIKMIDTAMIAVEDKHIENIEKWLDYGSGHGTNYTVYAVRIISTYVTFYKTVIPSSYFEELSEEGLPQKQSVEILRWPEENIPIAGLNIAEPEGRREVLEILIKIRKHLVEKGNYVY
ncbi:3785_t:CDS:2, partial [Racocetra persica]